MAIEKKTQKYSLNDKFSFKGTIGDAAKTEKKPPNVVSQILTGWGNLVKSHFVELSPELKAQSTNRLLICNSCDMRNGGTCNPNKTGIHVKTGAEIRGCGCRLAAKALSPGSVCPLGKW
mgnify:FL=1|jgi:hypothetical protein|tara:strand:- start:222 stop:578 length:357 start_codon:yes stop_codon:yes gene_type:complete